MDVIVKNCNCLDEAKICIQENKLNIKYGPNGTGKSTISKALELIIAGEDLSELRPFKYRGASDSKESTPSVSGVDKLKSIKVFNEAYINQFIFKEDELIENSFDIFVKTQEYDKQMEAIDRNLLEIKKTFEKSEALEQITNDLLQLSQCFGKKTKDQPFHGSSTIGKSIGKGNKLVNIPKQLNGFADYLNSKENVGWINWQIKGNAYVDISSACPYCTSPTEDKKEVIKAVSKEFDSKVIENLNKLKDIFDKLKKYFSIEAQENFQSLFNNATEISPEGSAFLERVKIAIDALQTKLSGLRSISYFSLKDDSKVIEKIASLKIDMSFLTDLNSIETKAIVDEVNSALEKVIANIGILQGEVAKQRIQVERTIKSHRDEINAFLKYAGYKYTIDILFEDDSYKMKLFHAESDVAFTDGHTHLSFGERNAFAIILFMYQCLSESPDLIILDDPISSFDKNKKFALMDALFRKETALKGKTVLMLTHDFEPVVDLIYTKKDFFGGQTTAAFLQSNGGVVNEIEILAEDVMSFIRIGEQILDSKEDDIIKLVFLRRLYEISNEKGLSYQLVSSLLHKREEPTLKDNGSFRDMTEAEVLEASTEVRNRLPAFDYKALLARVKDDDQMLTLYKSTSSRHGKLKIFRIIKQDRHDNDVVAKFINESFHIENDYIMQLHPSKYEMIPQYIVDECDKALIKN